MQDLAQRLGNRGAAFLGEKLDFVKKQIAKIQKPGEGELGADGFEGSFGSSGGEDSPTAPIMITYLLQNVDGEDEENVFCVPDASSASRVTLDKIRRRFPVPGHFWFRFKTAYVADGGGDGDYLWLDPIYPSEPVPTYKGQIVMKVLSVPADVLPPPPPPAPTPISTHPHHLASAEGSPPAVVRRRAHTPGPSRDGAATSPRRTLSSNEQARESVSETPGVIMGGGGERMRHHGVRGGGSENLSAGGAKSHPASPLQPSISPSMEHDDLLDFGAGERDDDNLPASAAGGVPVQQLDRDELVRKRLEAKHQRVAEVYTEHNERRQKEATKLQEKIEAGCECTMHRTQPH
mmetsp:Transcript_11616/g.33811  ORF Transcript_11616/g.33811 Transcript_11616/m.33811 type:complete len:348 (+) Transcript_11616:85-1128(+)